MLLIAGSLSMAVWKDWCLDYIEHARGWFSYHHRLIATLVFIVFCCILVWIVARCQHSEHVWFNCRWLDGSFADLNPDLIASEVEDLSKDLYKLMKVFTNRHKKQMAQRDERERERKRSLRRQSTVVDANDPSLVTLRKPENQVAQPAAISVCERVINQLSDFRVHFSLLLDYLESFVILRCCCHCGMLFVPCHMTLAYGRDLGSSQM